MKFRRFNLSKSNKLWLSITFLALIYFNVNFVQIYFDSLELDSYNLFRFAFILIIDILFVGISIYMISMKIELTDIGVVYSSLFHKTEINWSDIKSYGVFLSGMYGYKTLLEFEDYFKNNSLNKIIFISSENDILPETLYKTSKSSYITFSFRDEVMRMVINKMKKI
jgi:hypothetical protein